MGVLEASELVKTYGRQRALDRFTLHVAAGEIVGLVGHNGAGKTTFAEVVTGLVRPEDGQVRVCGVDAVARSRAARRLISACPQETALYPAATVAEHLRLFGALAGLRGAGLARAADDIAERMDLTSVTGKPAGLLSGGQRKRVQAATALIAERPLLLLDEPTMGADPATRSRLLAVVADRAAAGAAIVYTTHYLPELTELGASVAVAASGRIIARGPRDELNLEQVALLLGATSGPGRSAAPDSAGECDSGAPASGSGGPASSAGPVRSSGSGGPGGSGGLVRSSGSGGPSGLSRFADSDSGSQAGWEASNGADAA